jgi:hypothetical protein
MLSNRSMPECTVIPVLAYPDITEASSWLRSASDSQFACRLGIIARS